MNAMNIGRVINLHCRHLSALDRAVAEVRKAKPKLFDRLLRDLRVHFKGRMDNGCNKMSKEFLP
jgi:hypothetical protein